MRFGRYISITNESRTTISATLLPDGFIDFSATHRGDHTATVDIHVLDRRYVLVAIGPGGTFTRVSGNDLHVPLDGRPHYAILPRSLLP